MKISHCYPLLAALAIVSASCRTETVNCAPGTAEVYAVGFNHTHVASGKVTHYAANTNTVLDSLGVDPGNGPDTVRLFTMRPGYDTKYQLSDGTTLFFNHVTLSGIKQQTYKYGIIGGKAVGCIERIVSYDLNGQHYDISAAQYDRIYIR